MTRNQLTAAVDAAKQETRAALELLFGELNPGQQNKLLKEEKVQQLFDLYGVEE